MLCDAQASSRIGFAASFLRRRTCDLSDSPRLSDAKRHGTVRLVPAGCVGSVPHHRVLLHGMVDLHGPGFSKVVKGLGVQVLGFKV